MKHMQTRFDDLEEVIRVKLETPQLMCEDYRDFLENNGQKLKRCICEVIFYVMLTTSMAITETAALEAAFNEYSGEYEQ